MTYLEASVTLGLKGPWTPEQADEAFRQLQAKYVRQTQYATDPVTRDRASDALKRIQQAYTTLTGNTNAPVQRRPRGGPVHHAPAAVPRVSLGTKTRTSATTGRWSPGRHAPAATPSPTRWVPRLAARMAPLATAARPILKVALPILIAILTLTTLWRGMRMNPPTADIGNPVSSNVIDRPMVPESPRGIVALVHANPRTEPTSGSPQPSLSQGTLARQIPSSPVARPEVITNVAGRRQVLQVVAIPTPQNVRPRAEETTAELANRSEAFLPPPQEAWLVVKSTPWATVELDGAYLDNSPWLQPKAAYAGSRRIRLVAPDGRLLVERDIHLAPNSVTEVTFILSKRSFQIRTLQPKEQGP